MGTAAAAGDRSNPSSVGAVVGGPVTVAVSVDVASGDRVDVVGTSVAVGTGVAVGAAVGVRVGVVGTGVAVTVGVAVGVSAGAVVGTGVAVDPGTGVGVTVAVWVLFPRLTRTFRDSASFGDATVSVWSPASPASVSQPRDLRRPAGVERHLRRIDRFVVDPEFDRPGVPFGVGVLDGRLRDDALALLDRLDHPVDVDREPRRLLDDRNPDTCLACYHPFPGRGHQFRR